MQKQNISRNPRFLLYLYFILSKTAAKKVAPRKTPLYHPGLTSAEKESSP